MQIEHYVDEDGEDLFGRSLLALPPRARRRALAAIDRMEAGNFGDWKAVGGRLREHRIHSEGGIRIYYPLQDGEIILLLITGLKNTQGKDIRLAQERLERYEQKKN